MTVAALITWLITALGGFYLLGTWLSRGGIRQQQARTSRFPAPVIFGHFLLAAAGLIVWIVYVAAHAKALAWAAFVILLPVALLGFTMFFRWIGVYRATPAAVPAASSTEVVPAGRRRTQAGPRPGRPRRHPPLPC